MRYWETAKCEESDSMRFGIQMNASKELVYHYSAGKCVHLSDNHLKCVLCCVYRNGQLVDEELNWRTRERC